MTDRPFVVRDIGEIAIRCSDIEGMFAFYRDVIGLEPLSPPADGIAFLRIAQGHAGHTKVLALFRPDAGLPAIHPQGEAAPATGATSSLHHLALNIDYAAQQAAVDWLRSRGLDPRIQEFRWVGWRGVFLRDPEGNTVELVAYAEELRETTS